MQVMEKSQSIKNIAAALILFHVKVDKVGKDSTNPFFKSKYASLSNILEAINDPLNECGLSFVQFPTGENGLTTVLMHADSGEFMQADYIMKPVKDDPQGKGSVITYQRRYALSAILGLNIDEDDDGNAASRKSESASQKNGNTLYNHKKLDDPAKPLITNILFKKACDRMRAGEIGVYEKTINAFSFEPGQRRAFDSLNHELNQPA